MAGDVGGSRDDRTPESPEQLPAEFVVGNPNAERTLVGNEVRRDADGTRQNQREGLGGQLHDLESDAGSPVDIAHDHVGRSAEHQHGLLVVGLLETVNLSHGFGVGSIAPQPQTVSVG